MSVKTSGEPNIRKLIENDTNTMPMLMSFAGMTGCFAIHASHASRGENSANTVHPMM